MACYRVMCLNGKYMYPWLYTLGLNGSQNNSLALHSACLPLGLPTTPKGYITFTFLFDNHEL